MKKIKPLAISVSIFIFTNCAFADVPLYDIFTKNQSGKLVYLQQAQPVQQNQTPVPSNNNGTGTINPSQYANPATDYDVVWTEEVRIVSCEQAKQNEVYRGFFPELFNAVPSQWYGYSYYEMIPYYTAGNLSYKGENVGTGAAVESRMIQKNKLSGTTVSQGTWGPVVFGTCKVEYRPPQLPDNPNYYNWN